MALSHRIVCTAVAAGLALASAAAPAREAPAVCATGLGHVLLQTQRFLDRVGGTQGPQVLRSGDAVFLSVPGSGNPLTAQEDGALHTKWGDRGLWQKFVIEKEDGSAGEVHSGDAIFLTAWTGNPITVEDDKVHAQWEHKGRWQRIVVMAASGTGPIMSGAPVFLQTHIGTYIDANSGDRPGEVWARYSDRGDWQQFILEVAGRPRAGISMVAWAQFELLNTLRSEGFTCPGGVAFEPNSEALKFDCRVWKASLLHAQDMVESGSLGHASRDGRGPWERAREQGVFAHAENIAAGRGAAADALAQMQQSEDHCVSMMNPNYKVVGVAHAEGGPFSHYWVQMFSRTDEGDVDTSCYPSTSP